MTTIGIALTTESKIASVAKTVLDTLSLVQRSMSAAPQSFLMKPDTMAVSREEVERKLSQPAWRSTGRYL